MPPCLQVIDDDSSVKIRCSNAGKDFAPEEISAQVLRKLTNDAAKFLGDKASKEGDPFLALQLPGEGQ